MENQGTHVIRRSAFIALALGLTLSAAMAADTWKRIGRGGFAGAYNALQTMPGALCSFKGKLHAATGESWGRSGGQIWRLDGSTWVMVHKPKPSGGERIDRISAMAVLGDYLYAAVGTNTAAYDVWRTAGTGGPPYTWTKISGPANIGKDAYSEIQSMAASGSSLFVGTRAYQGCRIWRFSGSAWSQEVGQGSGGSPTAPGFGNEENTGAASMAVFPSGDLVVGTSRYNGGEVWRRTPGGWTRMNVPGFGKATNGGTTALAFLGSTLYAAVEARDSGCQVWKYLGPNAANWKAVTLDGFGDPENDVVTGAAVFGSPARLYLLIANGTSGGRAIRTNGATWQAASAPGFGRGKAITWTGGLAVHEGVLYAGAATHSGGVIYATSGGSKVPHVWALKNDPGFTRNNNFSAKAAAIFQGDLYVGTENGRGCEVWRRRAGQWTRVATGGFGDEDNAGVMTMAADNAFLYAGTNNWQKGCEIWRYDGVRWARVNRPGFGDARTPEASAMIFHGGRLYVGTSSYDTRGKVWRFDGPGQAQWTKINTNGFGVSHTVGVVSLAVLNDKLYAGTYDANDPCRVWRYDGPGPTHWTAVSLEGFGIVNNRGAYTLAVHGGKLYAGTYNNKMTGCEIWRYQGSGISWDKVSQDGFGDKNNGSPTGMLSLTNRLFVGTSNWTTGGELWATDGQEWWQVNKNGFGSVLNVQVNALLAAGPDLIAGTYNDAAGCEVWTSGPTAGAEENEGMAPESPPIEPQVRRRE